MTAMEPETESLNDFAADPRRFIEKVRSTSQPLYISIEGGDEELVVLNGAEYSRMVDKLERLEVVAAIREGLEDASAGRVVPGREALEELGRKLNLLPVADE